MLSRYSGGSCDILIPFLKIGVSAERDPPRVEDGVTYVDPVLLNQGRFDLSALAQAVTSQ